MSIPTGMDSSQISFFQALNFGTKMAACHIEMISEFSKRSSDVSQVRGVLVAVRATCEDSSDLIAYQGLTKECIAPSTLMLQRAAWHAVLSRGIAFCMSVCKVLGEVIMRVFCQSSRSLEELRII